jgi:hypothetical protein
MDKAITDTSEMDSASILTKLQQTVQQNRENLGESNVALVNSLALIPGEVPTDFARRMLRLVEELLVRQARPGEFNQALAEGDTDDPQAGLYYADAQQELSQAWRESYPRGYSTRLPPGITDSRGWTDVAIGERLNQVKIDLDWENTTGSARKWWDTFELENTHRVALVLRVAEELKNRRASITEFFLAYEKSNTDNIQANLYYLDYTLQKEKDEERKKREAAAEMRKSKSDENQPSAPPDDHMPQKLETS